MAHRFFDSPTRRYHIADSPGHEQYTRNIATAASHADALLLVLDARSGVKPQTLTHLGIASKLGITRFVIAVNKMDLVDYKKRVFNDIATAIEDLFATAHSPEITFQVIPVSGLAGDNVVKRTRRMSWWAGGTLLESLDNFSLPQPRDAEPVFAIQIVQRVPGGGRRYLGSLLQGRLTTGDSLSSPRYRGREFQVTQLAASGVTTEAVSGPKEISVAINAEVDLERGDVLGATEAPVEHTDQFEADLVWLDDATGYPGRTYLLRLGHQATKATITRVFDVGLDEEKTGQVDSLWPNSITGANIETHEKISLAKYLDQAELGRLVLIDPTTGNTVAAGVVNHTLRRADNLVAHDFTVDDSKRSLLTGHQGVVAWFTGLSGSGKSTLANEVSVLLTADGVPHVILDGDALRLGLNRDLGFTEADRVENIRRAAEVAKLMASSGLVVLVSLISPYRSDRQHAKEIIGTHRFIEVFVDTPLELCEQRDPKGLYKKAREGLIPNFTGIGAPYEAPENPDIRISPEYSPAEAATSVRALLEK